MWGWERKLGTSGTSSTDMVSRSVHIQAAATLVSHLASQSRSNLKILKIENHLKYLESKLRVRVFFRETQFRVAAGLAEVVYNATSNELVRPWDSQDHAGFYVEPCWDIIYIYI